MTGQGRSSSAVTIESNSLAICRRLAAVRPSQSLCTRVIACTSYCWYFDNVMHHGYSFSLIVTTYITCPVVCHIDRSAFLYVLEIY